jgi:biofilm PGA synthesis protein PgaD
MKFDADELIINQPDLVPAGQKFTAMGITLFFWGALLYLWQPLISILAWGLNIDLFYSHMILLGGYEAFLQLLAGYLEVIVALGGGLIIWARINLWRFRGKDRRRGVGVTDMEKLHGDFGVGPDALAAANNSRIVKISINDEGRMTNIQVAADPQFTQTTMASTEPLR